MEAEVDRLARELSQRLVAKKCTKIATLDFEDLQQRPSELGRYLALELAGNLVNADGVTVVDRANLSTIMKEHQLTTEGLLNPAEAKKLGQFAGVSAILLGSLAPTDEGVVVFVRAISTETAEVVASAKAKIPRTQNIEAMLRQSVSGTPVAGPAPSGRASASASEGNALLIRTIGPAIATLRNVVPATTFKGDHEIPVIRCTFDLENKDLKSAVVVASVLKMDSERIRNWDAAPVWGSLRGAATSSDGTEWVPVETVGVPSLATFECVEFNAYTGDGSWTQDNPGGVVEAIRTGMRYAAPAERERLKLGTYWSGSLGTIPPGGSARVTTTFQSRARAQGDVRSPGKSNPASWPEHFQFDLELVIGTISPGEEPTTARDLLVRTLTVDRVVLPKPARGISSPSGPKE